MSLVKRWRSNVEAIGLGPTLMKASHKAIGVPRLFRLRSPLAPFPVWLRFGTTDLATFNQVLRREDYRFGLPAAPQVIIDAGANVGTVSVYYAALFPEAKIFSLEPHPGNFSILRRNLAPYPNALAIHAALWEHDGTVDVVSPGRGEDGFMTQEGKKVRAFTIATLLRELGISKVDLLKVDIEGAERQAFRSCTCVERIDNIVIELHDFLMPGCSAAVESALRGFIRSDYGGLTWFRRS